MIPSPLRDLFGRLLECKCRYTLHVDKTHAKTNHHFSVTLRQALSFQAVESLLASVLRHRLSTRFTMGT